MDTNKTFWLKYYPFSYNQETGIYMDEFWLMTQLSAI